MMPPWDGLCKFFLLAEAGVGRLLRPGRPAAAGRDWPARLGSFPGEAGSYNGPEVEAT